MSTPSRAYILAREGKKENPMAGRSKKGSRGGKSGSKKRRSAAASTTARAPGRKSSRGRSTKKRGIAAPRRAASRRRRNPVETPIENPIGTAFAENPRRVDHRERNNESRAKRSRAAKKGRRGGSRRSSAERSASARKAARTRKRNMSMGRRRNPIEENPIYDENPMYEENPRGRRRSRRGGRRAGGARRGSMMMYRDNPMVSWTDTAIALGTTALFVVVAEAVDRYVATRAKNGLGPFYASDATARITQKADGTRLAVQAVGAVAGLAGAAYMAKGKGAGWGTAILGGIGAGFGINLVRMLLNDYLMPVVFKASNVPTDATLANRLYADRSAGAQMNLANSVAGETVIGGLSASFPWVAPAPAKQPGTGTTGLQGLSGSGHAPALGQGSPNFAQHWPSQEPVAAQQYDRVAQAVWQAQAAQAQAQAGLAGCGGGCGGDLMEGSWNPYGGTPQNYGQPTMQNGGPDYSVMPDGAEYWNNGMWYDGLGRVLQPRGRGANGLGSHAHAQQGLGRHWHGGHFEASCAECQAEQRVMPAMQQTQAILRQAPAACGPTVNMPQQAQEAMRVTRPAAQVINVQPNPPPPVEIEPCPQPIVNVGQTPPAMVRQMPCDANGTPLVPPGAVAVGTSGQRAQYGVQGLEDRTPPAPSSSSRDDHQDLPLLEIRATKERSPALRSFFSASNRFLSLSSPHLLRSFVLHPPAP